MAATAVPQVVFLRCIGKAMAAPRPLSSPNAVTPCHVASTEVPPKALLEKCVLSGILTSSELPYSEILMAGAKSGLAEWDMADVSAK